MGGAEQVLKMIAEYYLERNYQIDVFFLTKSVGNLWSDLKDRINLFYTRANTESKGFVLLFNNLRKINYSYEYAYTSHIYLNSFIGLLKKFRLIKINYLVGRDSHSYFLVESGIKRLIYNTIINLGYTNLDLLICQTNEMKLQFIANKKKLAKRIKIEVIPNPVSLNFSRHYLQEEICLALPQNDFVVSAGRLIKLKGYDVLIKAFSMLQVNNLELVILGEGEERNNLEQLVIQLNLNNRVLLPGFVEDVYPYFEQAAMCVVSSIKEGFPNVLLQMMSQNDKVVSTLCAGGIERIKGLFTCQSNDENALYVQMEKCLCADTKENRLFFDNELTGRSIERFVEKANQIIYNHG
jgi:glycosyltransferase involved in cell wall biosynthesis